MNPATCSGKPRQRPSRRTESNERAGTAPLSPRTAGLADLGRETPKCQLHTNSALSMGAANIFGQFRRLKVALSLDHAGVTSETKGRLEEPLPRKYTRKALIA